MRELPGFTRSALARHGILAMLNKSENNRRLRPLQRSRGSGFHPLAMVVVGCLIAAFLLPSMPAMVSPADDGPSECGCGCGKPKGKCCCSAPRTSKLAIGCAERDDPNQPADPASGGKIIGPPAPIKLMYPLPVSADLAHLELNFTDHDFRPEVPPPRT